MYPHSSGTSNTSNSICEFKRSMAPECADKIIPNGTESDIPDYKINTDACEALLESMRTYSCLYPGSQPCNLEFMLDSLLVMNLGDAAFEMFALVVTILALVGSLWTPETIPDCCYQRCSSCIPCVIGLWKRLAAIKVFLIWTMIVDCVLCVVTALVTAWAIHPAQTMSDIGCLNRLSPSYITLGKIATENLKAAIVLGVLETFLAILTFTQVRSAGDGAMSEGEG